MPLQQFLTTTCRISNEIFIFSSQMLSVFKNLFETDSAVNIIVK